MTAELESESPLEIAHVLFTDIVGYSKLLSNEQRELIQLLNEIVCNTQLFRLADAAGKLVRLPTGDGMALAFSLDAIISYTFNYPVSPTQTPVAGYAKDGKKSANSKDEGSVSTAAYDACGWRAWLNGTTITAGMNNILDQAPPFAIGAPENGYDESTFDIKGRFWYVALKKRF